MAEKVQKGENGVEEVQTANQTDLVMSNGNISDQFSPEIDPTARLSLVDLRASIDEERVIELEKSRAENEVLKRTVAVSLSFLPFAPFYLPVV